MIQAKKNLIQWKIDNGENSDKVAFFSFLLATLPNVSQTEG